MNKMSSDSTLRVLDYGDFVTFGTKGTISRLETRGLDLHDGDHHTWTMSPIAELEFGLRLPSEKIELRMEAAPYIQENVATQQVFIYINGLFVSFFILRERQILAVAIDRAVISSRVNRMSLVMPNAVSPQVLGLGDDQRQLGIALTSFGFRST